MNPIKKLRLYLIRRRIAKYEKERDEAERRGDYQMALVLEILAIKAKHHLHEVERDS